MVAARIAAAATFVLAACVAQDSGPRVSDVHGPATPARLLVPLQVIAAARLAPGVDRTGTPLPRSGVAPLTSFIQPAAVAMAGNDFYIADSGARRLYRLDAALASMAVVQSAPVALGVRIAVGHDFSLYVLDPRARAVLRLSRDGRVLARYADSVNLSQPVAFAIDAARGDVLVADRLFNLLVEFHPLAGARQVIPLRGDDRNRVMSVVAIALAGGTIQVSDALCRCVHVVDREGRVRESFGHGELDQPGAIAVDRHARTFVADAFRNSLKVFIAGRLVYEASAATLGVAQISDFAVDEDRLVVADGVGARVVVLRIAAPQRMD